MAARGCVRAALEVVVGGLVGGHHARAGAGLDRHVADGHAALHGERTNGRAAVFEHVALAAVGADLGDHSQDDVFGANAGAQRALHVHGHCLERLKRQGLRGQHVLNLAGADADCHGAKSAVRGGVRVAADDGDAGHGESQLRAHHVHDALLDVAQRVQDEAFSRREQHHAVGVGDLWHWAIFGGLFSDSAPRWGTHWSASRCRVVRLNYFWQALWVFWRLARAAR